MQETFTFHKMQSLIMVALMFLSLDVTLSTGLEDNEEAYMTAPELIAKYGYPIEQHYITTSDGYILAIHRIPHGKSSNTISNKIVYIQHGILSSSSDFIITGVDHALGYILADAGFDVWMGNARGNKYSRNHTSLDPDKDAKFWDFSWHEIGVIDVPTIIDFILEKTGQSQIFHIGHSQGTTTYYVMISMLPEYNDKIKAHISLAPIGYVKYMTSPLLRIMAFWAQPIELLLKIIGVNEFLPSTEFMALAGDALCSDDEISQALCTNTLFALSGFSPKEMNATILPVLLGHYPAGASTKQLIHYAQEIKSGKFEQYDHGLDNLAKYGSVKPPEYDLSRITSPVYMFYSHNDWLSGVKDVMKLCEEIGDACVKKILVADKMFNHLDYLYGIYAPEYVYSKIIKLLNEL